MKKEMKKRWTVKEMGSQAGKNIVITGTGGLGYESAISLAGAGANVIIAGRNADKGKNAVQSIKNKYPHAKIDFQKIDLADLSSIQNFSKILISKFEKLDILINNAGVMATPDRRVTKDNFELQLGTNYLGHFALTVHLLPLLRKARDARVVTVSSMAHRSGKNFYTRLIYHTLQMPSQGARASLLAATSSEVKSGSFYGPTKFMEIYGYPKLVKPAKLALDAATSAKLWDLSCQLVNLEPK